MEVDVLAVVQLDYPNPMSFLVAFGVLLLVGGVSAWRLFRNDVR